LENFVIAALLACLPCLLLFLQFYSQASPDAALFVSFSSVLPLISFTPEI